MNTLDATGKQVIIGNRYGYAQNSSGVTTTVIGIVEKFTKTGATIRVKSALRGLYSYPPTQCFYEKEKVVVKCLILFPV